MDEFELWLLLWIEKNLTYTNFMRATDEDLARMLARDMKTDGFKVIREGR